MLDGDVFDGGVLEGVVSSLMPSASLRVALSVALTTAATHGNLRETPAPYALGVSQQHPPVTITIESPRQPEVERLLDASSAYAQSLYPPESNFLLDLTDLERPEVAFYVARIGERAVGIAALVVESTADTDGEPPTTGELATTGELPTTGELKRMFVDPSARGRGVAGALLTRIEADAAARGIHQLVLETGDLHHAAQSLYRRHGYRRIPQFGQYVGEPHSVCFAKPLAAFRDRRDVG